MSRRRTSHVPAPPLDDEDLLREILLRLPPKPSSLPRASVVCKLWRSILSDPHFLKRFRKHHRRPPLLGFFSGPVAGKPVFTPVLDSPDRIHFARFSMPWSYNTDRNWRFTDSRHGLVVLINQSRREIVVWDPLTGQHNLVNFPPGLSGRNSFWHAAVLCADGEDGHVHGDCFLSPFKLVLLCDDCMCASACLYESASGVWGNVVSTATRAILCLTRHNVLVRDAIYWLFTCGGDILVFDLERQSLGVIERPEDAHVTNFYHGSVKLLRTVDSRLGFAHLSQQTIQLWERSSNCDGVAGWVMLQDTIPLEGMLPWRRHCKDKVVLLVGYDEDTNVIVLYTKFGNFTLQLDSMQITHIIKRKKMCDDIFCSYTNFYTAGRGVGWKWLDLKLRTHAMCDC